MLLLVQLGRPAARDIAAPFALILVLALSVFSALSFAGIEINLMREARLILGLGLICYMIGGDLTVDRRQVEHAVLGSLAILLALVIAQRFALGGFRWFLPTEFYSVSTDGALASDEVRKAFIGGYSVQLRPTGFFSEPSYLGLGVLSLFYIGINAVERRRIVALAVLVLAICLLSGSLYAVTSCLALAAWHMARGSYGARKNAFGALIMVVGLLLALSIGAQSTRVQLLIGGMDPSGMTRVVRPFGLIAETLATQPLGVTSTGAYDYLLAHGMFSINEDAPIHNGLLNLAIFYGIPGVMAVLIVLSRARTLGVALYVLLAFIQNGSVASFDKVFVIALTAIMANGLSIRPGSINSPAPATSRAVSGANAP